MEARVGMPTWPDSWGTAWLHVAAAAVVLTGLNAVKPVHIDDPAYLGYAAEFAAHPLQPYGFEFGSPHVHPANDMLVPPVLPYWLGVGRAVLGDHPAMLKAWLLPFALALAWGVDFLAARAAPSLRGPLVWLAVLSPTVVPGFNLMLEVPVLAVGLAALAAGVRSVERDSWGLAVLAGLLAGLAFETKYTGVTASVAVLAWCVLHRRPVRGIAVVVLAGAVVLGWEGLVAWTAGQSHFLVHVQQRQSRLVARVLHLVLPLVTQTAGLAPAVALLGMAALGWARRSMAALGLAVVGAVAMLMVVPSQQALIARANGSPVLTPSNLVYGMLAVPVWAGLAGVVGAMVSRVRDRAGGDRVWEWFLLAWVAVEVAGYFALSPYPAARRLTGPLLAMTLLAGRLAHVRGVRPGRAVQAALGGAALALLLFATDVLDARAARQAAEEVARQADLAGEHGTVWHASWWGFAYHADRLGLRPLQVNRELPRPGDLLAIHDLRELRQAVAAHPEIGLLEPIGTVEAGDRFPLQLGTAYYAGRTPLEHFEGPRIRVSLYRVGDRAAGSVAAR